MTTGEVGCFCVNEPPFAYWLIYVYWCLPLSRPWYNAGNSPTKIQFPKYTLIWINRGGLFVFDYFNVYWLIVSCLCKLSSNNHDHSFIYQFVVSFAAPLLLDKACQIYSGLSLNNIVC